MSDLRLQMNYWRHPKTIIVIEEAGLQAAVCFQQTWIFAVETGRFDGDLSGYTDRMIAKGSGWAGKSDVFVSALVSAGYLEGEEGSRVIHDWAEHQPYVAAKPVRIRRARAGGQAKAEKARQAKAPAHRPPRKESLAMSVVPQIEIDDWNTAAELRPQASHVITEEIVPVPIPAQEQLSSRVPPIKNASERESEPPVPFDYPSHLPPPATFVIDAPDYIDVVREMYERFRPANWASVPGSGNSLSRDILQATGYGHGACEDMTLGQLWQAFSALQKMSWMKQPCRNLPWLLDRKNKGANLWRAMQGGFAEMDTRRDDPMKDTNSPEFMAELMRIHSESEERRAAGALY